MLRAKNKSRRKLHRKFSSSSSSEIPSTPAGGGTNNTTTPSISTVTDNERYRQHADEEQYDYDNSNSDDDDDDDDADNNDDLVYDIKLSEVQNNESSGQPAGFIKIQLQSDSNDNSINLNKVPEDTPLGQLAVNFKRFNIFLFI